MIVFGSVWLLLLLLRRCGYKNKSCSLGMLGWIVDGSTDYGNKLRQRYIPEPPKTADIHTKIT